MSTTFIGQPISRVDGRDKVTGRATYAAEFRADNVAHAAVVRSTVARGRIASIDTALAQGAPGVLAVITSATVAVAVLSDKVFERNETLVVTLSAAVNATLADGASLGTIVNDDTRVGLALRRATQHRVRVGVATVPAAALAPVKVYRVLHSGATRMVLATTLDASGHLSVRLDRH